MKLLVLMYHIVYASDAEFNSISDEEKPYAISKRVFEEQLSQIKQSGLSVMKPEEVSLMLSEGKLPNKDSCLITIDDGHNSMLNIINPLLIKNNFGSVFFVSTQLIEQRQDFCSWHELQKLSQQGVCVQPHGHTHQFFDAMDVTSIDYELAEPKKLIESHLLQPVKSMSYPGGRCNALSLSKAYEQGYTSQFGSDVGLNDKVMNRCTYKRMAIRASTSHKEFSKIISFSNRYYLLATFEHKIKKSLKLLCGNNGYHHLYRLVKRK